MGRLPRSYYDRELDLHGMTVDEALREVDRAVCGIQRGNLMVIHGRGDGLLRRAIRGHLVKHPMVAEAIPGESVNFPGGDGVTIIYLTP